MERIMYIENKSEGLVGKARIGLVKFSKSRKSIHYKGQTFHTLKGAGHKSNFYDTETEEEYWISGCKRDGSDRLYGERLPIHIDPEIQEVYWLEIRNQPDKVGTLVING